MSYKGPQPKYCMSDVSYDGMSIQMIPAVNHFPTWFFNQPGKDIEEKKKTPVFLYLCFQLSAMSV